MKKLIIILNILIFSIFSCSTTEVEEFSDKGVITGPDTRECACCGGYFIDIGNATYRFYQAPPESNVNLNNAEFPIPVTLDWKKAENPCLGDEIVVLRMERD